MKNSVICNTCNRNATNMCLEKTHVYSCPVHGLLCNVSGDCPVCYKTDRREEEREARENERAREIELKEAKRRAEEARHDQKEENKERNMQARERRKEHRGLRVKI